MRLPSVLSPDDLPAPELFAAALDGEVLRLGGAFCPIDTIIGSAQRASSVRTESPAWAIAERHTAAWIYGAERTLNRPLHLCVDAASGVHPISTRHATFREVVIRDHEICLLAGQRITAPLRTAVDIARTSDDFTEQESSMILGLAQCGEFGLSDCVSSINARRNLPGKRVALTRLQRALDEH